MNEPDIDVEELKEIVGDAIDSLKALVNGIIENVIEIVRKLIETTKYANQPENGYMKAGDGNKEHVKTELFGPNIYDEDPDTLGTGPPNLL